MATLTSQQISDIEKFYQDAINVLTNVSQGDFSTVPGLHDKAVDIITLTQSIGDSIDQFLANQVIETVAYIAQVENGTRQLDFVITDEINPTLASLETQLKLLLSQSTILPSPTPTPAPQPSLDLPISVFEDYLKKQQLADQLDIDTANQFLASIGSPLIPSTSSTTTTNNTTTTSTTGGAISDAYNQVTNYFSQLLGSATQAVQTAATGAASSVPGIGSTIDQLTTFVTSTIADIKTSLTGFIAGSAIPGYLNFKKAFAYYIFGIGDRPTTGDFDIGISPDNTLKTGQDVSNLISELDQVLVAPKGILQVGAAFFLRLGIAAKAIASGLDPFFEDARYAANAQNPIIPIDVNRLVDAQYQGITSPQFSYKQAARQGVSSGDYDILYSQASYLPSLSEAAIWKARGFINHAEYNAFAGRNHASETIASFALGASIRPPSAGSAISAAGRSQALSMGFMNGYFNAAIPENILHGYDVNQIDRNQAVYDWALHYTMPSPEWFANAAYKGIRNIGDVEMAAISNNYPEEIAQQYADVLRPTLPVRVITTLLSRNLLTEQQARTYYTKIGYSFQDIDVLVAYAASLAPKTPKGVPGDLAKLALNEAISLFNDHILTQDQLNSIFLSHGYKQAAADLAIQYVVMKQATAERKQKAVDIVDQVDLKQITMATGVSQLFSAGYTNREVLRYEKMMIKNKIGRQKQPSLAEVIKMYKNGIINDQVLADYLANENYDAAWIPYLMALYTMIPATPATGQ